MNKINSVVLVDDDTTTNYVNQLLLEDLGVTNQILIAHNGEEALELISGNCENGYCPQLILLDINMPVMNGFEFMEAYQRLDSKHKQSVVVVMLTTSLNPGDVKRLQEVPINGFLNKPLTEDKVKALFKQHFGFD
jgi:CheY-like chemotaxis protein